MSPTAVFTPFDGRVEVRLFGRNGSNVDWRIDKVQKAEDLTEECALDQFTLIRHVALMAGVETVYAPNITVNNTLVCQPEDFTEHIALENSSFTLVRGAEVNGCVIPPRCGVWFSTADCHVVVATNRETGRAVAAHSDRDSLVDRARLEGGEASRPRPTIVLTILEELMYGRKKCVGAEYNIFTAGGIGPEHFSHPCGHPTHGERNKQLTDHVLSLYGPSCLVGEHRCGNVWLGELIRQQFMRISAVPPWHYTSDGVDTYTDRDAEGDFLWWSHRRATDRGEYNGRNGVLVVRRW